MNPNRPGLWYVPEDKIGYINAVVEPKAFWASRTHVFWQPYDQRCKREYIVLITPNEVAEIEDKIRLRFGYRASQNR